MRKILLPVTIIGWYLLLLGVAGFAGHFYLLEFQKYSGMMQAVVIILSALNVLFGLFFIFLRHILLLAIRLLLFFLFKKMAATASHAARKWHDQLLNLKSTLD